MRKLPLALAASAMLLAGCGTAHAAAPPSARALATRMHCRVIGAGEGFDGADTRQDINLGGTPAACQDGEVWTFPTAAAQRRWTARIAGAANRTYGDYNWMVTGRLWAVYPGSLAAVRAVIREVGGRESTYF